MSDSQEKRYEAVYGAIGDEWVYGLDIADLADFKWGTIYVALARLEREGRVESRWDVGDYPRRRMYRRAITREAA